MIAGAGVEEEDLGVAHANGQCEVKETHPLANLTNAMATVDVVHQQEEEDGDLNRQADPEGVLHFLASVAITVIARFVVGEDQDENRHHREN